MKNNKATLSFLVILTLVFSLLLIKAVLAVQIDTNVKIGEDSEQSEPSAVKTETTGDEVRFGGEDFVVPADTKHEGDIVNIGGGKIVVDGEQEGDVVAVGGSIEVRGLVDGDVVAPGGHVHLYPTAQVKGDAVAIGGKLEVEPGAVVSGDAVKVDFPFSIPFSKNFKVCVDHDQEGFFSWSHVLLKTFLIVVWLILAVIISAIFPKQVKTSAAYLDNLVSYAKSGLTGIGVAFALFTAFVAAGLLCIILVGIPVLFFLLFAIPVIWIYGKIGLFYHIGERMKPLLLKIFNKAPQRDVPVTIVGLLAAGLVLYIPYLGPFVWFLLGILGLGLIALTKFGTGQPWFNNRSAVKPTPQTNSEISSGIITTDEETQI